MGGQCLAAFLLQKCLQQYVCPITYPGGKQVTRQHQKYETHSKEIKCFSDITNKHKKWSFHNKYFGKDILLLIEFWQGYLTRTNLGHKDISTPLGNGIIIFRQILHLMPLEVHMHLHKRKINNLTLEEINQIDILIPTGFQVLLRHHQDTTLNVVASLTPTNRICRTSHVPLAPIGTPTSHTSCGKIISKKFFPNALVVNVNFHSHPQEIVFTVL